VRFVADTNIIISGLLWHGPPGRVLESARETDVELFTSPAILSELDDVLQRPKFESLLASVGSSAQAVLLQYAALAILVHPVYIPVMRSEQLNLPEEMAKKLAGKEVELIETQEGILLKPLNDSIKDARDRGIEMMHMGPKRKRGV